MSSNLYAHSFGTGLVLFKYGVSSLVFRYRLGARVIGPWLRLLCFGRASASVNVRGRWFGGPSFGCVHSRVCFGKVGVLSYSYFLGVLS